MKKFLYILLVLISVSATMISCTEEEIKPATDTTSSGGGGVEDKQRP